MTRFFRPLSLLIVLTVPLATSSGCTLRLISDYDEVIDRTATDLQKKIAAFLLKMEQNEGKHEGTYAANVAFHNDAKVLAQSMRIRAEARSKNELTIRHIRLIQENLEHLRKLHEERGDKGLSKAIIGPVRDLFHVQFKALITLELAKKRGD